MLRFFKRKMKGRRRVTAADRALVASTHWKEDATSADPLPPPKTAEEYYEAGLVLAKQDQLSEARLQFEKAADMGHVDAMYHAGSLYSDEDNEELTPDYPKAVTYFRQAAEHGDVSSQFQLAMLLLRSKNISGALKWLEAAAAGGNYMACDQLANGYYNGRFGTADYEKAMAYFLQAIELKASFATNYVMAARCCLKIGDRDSARKGLDYLAQYIASTPTAVDETWIQELNFSLNTIIEKPGNVP